MREKMNKYLLILSFLFILIGCENNSTENPEQKKIKIAAILDLSGHYKIYGLECKQALELIQKQYSNFEINFFDCQGINESADSILNLIIAENKKPVIVTLSSWISNYLAEKIALNNLLHIPVGSTAFNRSDLLSSVLMTVRVNNESEFLINKLTDYSKIAIMYINNDLGKSWNANLINGLEDKVVATETYDDSKTDFTEELMRIANKKPDIVVLITTSETNTILNQAKNLGINLNFIGTRPVLTNKLLSDSISNDLIFSYPKINYNFSLIKEFQTEYGYRPTSFSAECIDLCLLLKNAANSSKYTRDEVFQFTKNSTMSGSFNDIKFDELCRAEYEFTLMKIKNGSFEELE